MLFDSSGLLWMATDGGLCSFDGRYVKQVDLPMGRRITALFRVDTANAHWLGVVDDKVNVCYLQDGGLVKNAKVPDDVIIVRNRATFFRTAAAGNIMVRIIYGPSGFINASNDTAIVEEADCFGFYTHEKKFRTLKIDGCRYGGAQYYNCLLSLKKEKNGKTLLVSVHADGRYEEHDFPELEGSNFRVVCSIDTKNAFLVVDDRLYKLYKTADNKFHAELLLTNLESSRTVNQIEPVNEDDLLIATNTSGLYVYHRTPFSVFSSWKKDDLYVSAVSLVGQKDSFLIDNGVVVSKSGKPFIYKKGDNTLSRGGFLRTRSGNCWYVMQKPDLSGFEVIRAKTLGVGEEAIAWHQCIPAGLYEDRAGNIWYLGLDGIGYYRQGSGQYVRVWYQYTGQFNCIVEDSKGIIWVGADDGVIYLDPNKNDDSLHATAVKHIAVRFIKEDKALSGFWLATYGDGLQFFSPGSKPRLLKVRTNQGRNTDFIHNIIEDSLHRFWFATNNGLFYVNKRELDKSVQDTNHVVEMETPSYRDALSNSEFNGGHNGSYAQIPDGPVAMASMSGLVVFKPETIRAQFSTSKIEIRQILVDSIQMPVDQQQFTISERNSSLEFFVRSVDFVNYFASSIEYSLRHEHDSLTASGGWHMLPPNGYVKFSFLEAGDYSVVFRKKVSASPERYMYLTRSFTVTKVWYRRPVFYLFTLVCALMFISAASVVSIRKLKGGTQQLHKKIIENSKGIETQLAYLTNNNQIRDQVLGALSHDVSAPVFFINRSLKLIADDKSLSEEVREALRTIIETGYELEHMTDTLLDWTMSNKDRANIKLRIEQVSIADIFHEKWAIFKERSKLRKLTLELQFPEDTRLETDNHIMSIVVYNVLDNCVKYFRNGAIEVLLIRNEAEEVIGFLIEQVKRDEKPEPNGAPGIAAGGTLSQQTGQVQSRGFGLKISQELAQLIGFTIENRQSPGGMAVAVFKTSKSNSSAQLDA